MKTNIFIVFLIVLAVTYCNQKPIEENSTEKASEIEAPIPSTAKDFLTKDLVIDKGETSNHVQIYEPQNPPGKYITIIPSMGRGIEDYTEKYNSTITTKLVQAGFSVVLIQPRGIGKSSGDITAENVFLQDLANDIKTTLDSLGLDKIHVVGHAFGNRVARTFATMYTDNVDGLALLACGGNFEMDPEAKRCLLGSINMSLSDEQRLKMIDCAFFAEGNDASVWLNGWYPDLAFAQQHAGLNIDSEFYKKAGGKYFLVLQASEDFIAPPEKAGKALKQDLPDQVTYIEIENAGHALTSERPDRIAKELINYFNSL